MTSKNNVVSFLAFTFEIWIVFWGLCVILAQFGIVLSSHPWLYVLYLLGGFSPTIASYLTLKKNHEVSGVKEWFKNIFDYKAHISVYLLVVFLIAVLYVSQYFILGFTEVQPFYMFFALPPLMLIGGGMEEAGWRYILQPELDRRYGYIISSLLVSVIWALWHLPLFFIPGVGQYGQNFFVFAIWILGGTFILGAISRISGKVFPCILAHCMINAAFSVFNISPRLTLTGNLFVTGIVIIVSSIIVFLKNTGTQR